MSYYTHVGLEIDGDQPDPDALLTCAEAFVRDAGWAVEDVLADLKALIEEGAIDFKLYFEHIDGLFSYMSKQFPRVVFRIRGYGEEFLDVWLREYKSGVASFSTGPFG